MVRCPEHDNCSRNDCYHWDLHTENEDCDTLCPDKGMVFTCEDEFFILMREAINE